MIAPTIDCYDEICNDPRVRAQIDSLADNQDNAARRLWTRVAGSILVAAIVLALLHRVGWDLLGVIAALAVAALGAFWGFKAGMDFADRFKRPALEALSVRAGLEYQEHGFTPPAYADARKKLAGAALTCDLFNDLFHGKDEQGLRFAAYQASIDTGGRYRQILFKGQFFATERQSLSGATTLVAPKDGFFSLPEPPDGMRRVAFESDPAFDAAFDVYATSWPEAWQLLSDAKFRARLVALRVNGPLFAYIAPDDALIGVSGGDPCDPGPALKYESAYERLYPMVRGVCDMLATLAEMKAKFG